VSRQPLLIAQLSDPHIVANARLCLNIIDTASFLREAVETLNRLNPQPDVVIISGDLVNDGRVNQYEHLRVLLGALNPGLRANLLLMPGNHDDREHLRQVFPEHRELFPDVGASDSTAPVRCDFVRDLAGRDGQDRDRQDLSTGPGAEETATGAATLRLIALDTVIAGEPGGDLTESQLRWLEEQLGEFPERPALVLLHHPPFATGIAHMDACGLAPASASALAQVISRHSNVQRVSAGHVHRTISRRWAGTVASTVPSVAHAVALDLRVGSPVAAGAWNYEPPAVTLHYWDGEALITHQRACGEFPARKYESY